MDYNPTNPSGTPECDGAARPKSVQNVQWITQNNKSNTSTLNRMRLSEARGGRLISHNALSWWDNEKWSKPATCQYEGWSCSDSPGFLFNPVSFKMIALVTFSPAVCQLDIAILPLLLTFLLGFIYFKTPFHTRLILTRYYTALREGLGDRIVTDTTFFTAETRNVVNRRVYEWGRVWRGKPVYGCHSAPLPSSPRPHGKLCLLSKLFSFRECELWWQQLFRLYLFERYD